MPDIYSAIKSDHEKHRRLMAEIADTSGDSEARRAAWKEFFEDVKTHAAAEEETFYSKLMSKTWGQDTARHSVEEHAEMDDLMEELQGMDMSSPGWKQKFDKLREDYEHHMEEEEEEVFGRAKEVISDSEIEGYGDSFLKRKDKEKQVLDEKREDHLED